jgi:thiamine-phosphate pyrophosphorylase
MQHHPSRCRLYLVSPPAIALPKFAEDLKAALDAGDVACFQLRLKPATDDDILKAAEALLPICREKGVEFLINDRPDLAKKAGTDGVHVGQQDTGVAEARQILGPDATIGATCHASRHLAVTAGEQGADYVAFGAFFPTTTKPTPHRPTPDILRWWSELTEIPCVAIGGITPGNAKGLIEAGADFIAVSSAVWGASQGPAAAIREFSKVLAD